MLLELLNIDFTSIQDANQAIWWWVPIVLGTLAEVLIVAIIAALDGPDTKTVDIAILGLKGCGKTTMWELLQNHNPTKGGYNPSSRDRIESFKVKGLDGREVLISTTYDNGGGDVYVDQYNEVIKAGTMVYFLVDLTRMESQKREINARLRKIGTIFKDKRIENASGFQIVATHLDETGYTKGEAIEMVSQILKIKHRGNNITALDLFNGNDFQVIKNEIINAGINI